MSNPCLDCGVCCMTYRIAFHWSEVDDAHGVPSHLVEPFRRHEVIMIGTQGPQVRCIALKNDPSTGHLGCSIHGRHHVLVKGAASNSIFGGRGNSQRF